ncbi:MAG: D-alanyl-D-alanine carboxypeptidase [Actinobacteria bacterium]|nr:D-alanyl-D-alanine carboxypeptidase [Actinomycetota bacterium]
MKRFALLLILITVLAAMYIPLQNNAYADDLSFNLSSPSAIIIEHKTGEVLWAKNPDEKKAIASTTKIMTAILAIEREELDGTVTVGEAVLSAGRYGIKLSVGEQLSLEELLYALMLNSANDAAIAIADRIGGSVGEFTKLMNEKALRIGAENTNYTNPHGLADGSHYSTARDLALIARYAMRNKTFVKIVSTKERKLRRVDPKKPTIVVNRNKLLWDYLGVNGVKTGYTSEAGYCLVSSAKRENISLIAVILGSRSQSALFRESEALLNYGFSLYEKRKLISKGITYKTVKMRYGEKVNLVAAFDVETFVRSSIDIDMIIKSKPITKYPVKKGTVLGRVVVVQSGRTVATSDLVAEEDVKKPSLSQITRFYINQFLSNIFKARQTGSVSNHLWSDNHLLLHDMWQPIRTFP